jgi:hypothetical protein
MKIKFLLCLLSLALLWRCAKDENPQGDSIRGNQTLQTLLDSLSHLRLLDYEDFQRLKASYQQDFISELLPTPVQRAAQQARFVDLQNKIKKALPTADPQVVQNWLATQIRLWKKGAPVSKEGTANSLMATPCYDTYQHDLIISFEKAFQCGVRLNVKDVAGNAACLDAMYSDIERAGYGFHECIYDMYGENEY